MIEVKCLHAVIKTYQAVYLTQVNLIVCTVDLNKARREKGKKGGRAGGTEGGKESRQAGKLNMVAHTNNPSSRKAEAGEFLGIQSQQGLVSK